MEAVEAVGRKAFTYIARWTQAPTNHNHQKLISMYIHYYHMIIIIEGGGGGGGGGWCRVSKRGIDRRIICFLRTETA